MKIRVRFNQDKAHFRASECAIAGFGSDNSGLVVDFPGSTPREAFDAWQGTRNPGERLNPFYLIIAEEK